MSDSTAQNLSNHVRLDPIFHFVILPITGFNAVLSVAWFARDVGWRSGWIMILSYTALLAVFRIRIYALKVQDRVIRLEEQLRLATLLSDPLRSRIGQLTVSQLIALRFASDHELPALVQKALDQNLKSAEIKKAIIDWRADYLRV